ncbi:hypothetical protein AB0D08_24955 [Kitasatospora sp. NPDC048540]|uniref:hypothetical protein n=1 Tax=Kitasatospora sp. NPDC048540 TaxID=3155634 RepID=UPI0033E209B2
MTGTRPEPPDPLPATERVRLAVYHGFARTGRAPGVPELAALTLLTPDGVRRELRALHGSRDVVLDPQDGDRIVMAHPFASVPLGFSVVTPPRRKRRGFSLSRYGFATDQPGP